MASDDHTVISFRTPTPAHCLRGVRTLRSGSSDPARRVQIELRAPAAIRLDDTVSWAQAVLALKYWGLEVARDDRDGTLVIVKDDDPRLAAPRGKAPRGKRP